MTALLNSVFLSYFLLAGDSDTAMLGVLLARLCHAFPVNVAFV